MKTPLERIRIGAFLLAAITLTSVIGYRLIGPFNWVEAVWMTVISIATVGFGERSELSPALQLFTVGVIIFGMTAAFYTMGGFFQLITEGEIERALARRRMTQGIEHLKDHVILCGYGRLGQELAEDLHRQKLPFVVIDQDEERGSEAKLKSFLCLTGDATEDEILLLAGIKRASTLVTGLPNDAANVFITLTSRNLNPGIQIIARADHHTSGRKLRQAGADKVVMPLIVGAQRMSRMITHPFTADLMDLLSQRDFVDVELDEIRIPKEHPLEGTTVRETEAHRLHGLLVVAIKKANAQMVFNPNAEYQFEGGDVLVVMGKVDQILRFRQTYGL